MSLNAWQLGLGVTQGRIAPANAVPAQGSYVFCLGSDAKGDVQTIAVGDFARIAQNVTFPDGVYLRAALRIRPPTIATTAPVFWRFSIQIDGVDQVFEEFSVGAAERIRSDMAAIVADLSGSHEVAFQLKLVGIAGSYDLELPAVYIDAVQFDATSTRPALVNRDPEPGDVGVDPWKVLWLDILDPNPVGTIDTSKTKVYIGGLLAFDGGTFETGFDGPSSSASNPLANLLRLTINPTTPFSSEELVTVRVLSQVTGDATLVLDSSYSFTARDTAPPVVLSALAIDRHTIQVTFDGPVLASSSSGSDDTLNPASWTIDLPLDDTQTRLPAVTIRPTAIAMQTDSIAIVTTDIAMSAGATYVITANVVDTSGNLAALPTNVAAFLGFTPDQPEGREWNLWEWVPQLNRDDDDSGDLEKFVGLYQEISEQILFDIDAFPDCLDPFQASEAFVDAMLRDLGNPFDFELSLDDKRRLVPLLVPIYQQKGTDDGIINAVRFFLGIDVDIVPLNAAGSSLGFAHLGVDLRLGTSIQRDLYTFQVVSPIVLTAEQSAKMGRIVDYMKRAETHHELVGPTVPTVIHHWALGLSHLGVNSILH